MRVMHEGPETEGGPFESWGRRIAEQRKRGEAEAPPRRIALRAISRCDYMPPGLNEKATRNESSYISLVTVIGPIWVCMTPVMSFAKAW